MSEENQQKSVFIDEQVQKELNQPLKDVQSSGQGQSHQDFLSLLLGLIEEGKIDVHKPASLINFEVYDKLDELKQGKVDLEAVNLTNAIREIKDLHDAGFSDTYQMQNNVLRVKATKERLETEGGDLFII